MYVATKKNILKVYIPQWTFFSAMYDTSNVSEQDLKYVNEAFRTFS